MIDLVFRLEKKSNSNIYIYAQDYFYRISYYIDPMNSYYNITIMRVLIIQTLKRVLSLFC